MTLSLDKMHQNKAANIDRVEDGTYPGRLASIIDLGVQPMTDWQTKEPTDPKPRVLFTFELPTEKIEVEHEDGTVSELPRLISKEMTISSFERSNMMKYVNILSGGGEVRHLSALLDSPCMISVGSTTTGNAKIAQIAPPMKGLEVAPLTEPPVYFDYDDPNQEQFLSLKKWVQLKITESINYNGFADGWKAETEEASDDLPF